MTIRRLRFDIYRLMALFSLAPSPNMVTDQSARATHVGNHALERGGVGGRFDWVAVVGGMLTIP
jgi:hypothetical protein